MSFLRSYVNIGADRPRQTTRQADGITVIFFNSDTRCMSVYRHGIIVAAFASWGNWSFFFVFFRF